MRAAELGLQIQPISLEPTRGTILVEDAPQALTRKASLSDDLQFIEPHPEAGGAAADEAAALPAPAASLNATRVSTAFRHGRGSTSYCAETAWIWQRARLVCNGRE